MKIKSFLLFFFTVILSSFAQEIKSKGDKLFYSYAYRDAIIAYQKDLVSEKELSNHQYLNLADSYFHVGEYRNASKIYVDISKKDSILNDNRFNKMLQSLAKTSQLEDVKSILKDRSSQLSNELIENAAFNFELLGSSATEVKKFEIFNVSGNSPQSDMAPSFYKDKLLFSSGRPQKSKKIYGPSGESYLDIYVARIGRDGNILNPNIFDKMPESKFHKSTPYYSSASNKIYYILSNSENDKLSYNDEGKNALAIGMVYDNGFFAFLLKDLSTSFYYPFYDEIHERLYFSANFEDGYGGTDIYYVSTNNGQIMSEPVNLGPRINSPGNEIAPYLFENSLYFSSDVFYGLGGMDIYKSNFRGDKTFSYPVNLGAGINTKQDEFGFIIRGDEHLGFSGYLASNRPGGKGNDDIYGFRTKGFLGAKTIAFNGEVVEPRYKQGIAGVEVKLIDAEGNSIKKVLTNEEGKYQLEIPMRESIVVQITKDRYSSFYKTYVGDALEKLQNEPLIFEMVGIDDIISEREDKTVLKLNDFFFVRGKSIITEDIKMELDKVVDAIQKFPLLKLTIETHTDSRGGNWSNKSISEKRAAAIKKYLLDKGVSASNIVSAIGYGEEHIMNNCKNGVYCLDFLHKKNLRTLFVIQNYEELK